MLRVFKCREKISAILNIQLNTYTNYFNSILNTVVLTKLNCFTTINAADLPLLLLMMMMMVRAAGVAVAMSEDVYHAERRQSSPGRIHQFHVAVTR